MIVFVMIGILFVGVLLWNEVVVDDVDLEIV